MTDVPAPTKATGIGRLFIRKSVAQMHAEHAGSDLKRSLGALNLVLLGIGCIIGTGIFVLTGKAAAQFAGPAIMISFVITGLLCTFVALCYAELASAVPVSGSAYSYSYASMGELVAWFMGLLLILEYGLAASTVAVGWSGYLNSLLHANLHIYLPHQLTQAPGAWVATHDILTTVTNPTVDLQGAKAVFNGAAVTIHDHAHATLAGSFPVKFGNYDTVGAVPFDLDGKSVATLINQAVVSDVSGASQKLAAGTMLSFDPAAGSKATLAAEAVRALVQDSVVPTAFNLPALLAIGAVTALLVVGVSESASVNNVVVVIKVTVVVAFICIGAAYIQPRHWVPLIPDQVPAPPPGHTGLGSQVWDAIVRVATGRQTEVAYGVGGVIAGAARIFFAYIGFEAVSTAGAESKNPARDMPIGILGSLLICTVLYILTAGVLVGIVPYQELNDAAPIAKAVNQIGLPWFAVLVKIGAIAGLSSVMLVLLYGQTRIFYTIARDGLLPSVFAAVHPKFKTPWVNTLLVGAVVALAAGFMSLDRLADLTNVGSLLAFAIVCITVMYLRYAQPNLVRPFRTPLFPLVPILGAGMCLFLLMAIIANKDTRNFFLIYLGLGLVVYFAYSMWHSKLAKGEVVLGAEPTPDLPTKG